MVNVKIECGCGQHYTFEVEPVNGQMASSVACPVCGADGTPAANVIIANQLQASTATASVAPMPAAASLRVSGGGLKLSSSNHDAPTVSEGMHVDRRSLGMVDRSTAENEARAKMSWGDSKEDVTRYLMLQGFSASDATELVAGLYKERLAALRVKGIRKIVVGVGLMCVPVIAFIVFTLIHFMLLKLMALAVMAGLWGVWQLLNGIIMLVAPRMESGDLAD